MNAVFLDTVGLVALWDKTDQWHAAAEAADSAIKAARMVCVTTTSVLIECGNAASRRPYRADVEELRVRLEQSNLLIRPLEDDWQVAWAQYSQGDSQSPGIVDEISFAVMRRLGLTLAFTNDKHFRAAGFTTLF